LIDRDDIWYKEPWSVGVGKYQMLFVLQSFHESSILDSEDE
jgi:hypothetical protein